MAKSVRQGLWRRIRAVFDVRYEIKIRVTLGLLLLLLLVATLNSIRYFSGSRQLLTNNLKYRSAENLKAIADYVRDAPAQRLQSARFRELTRTAGLVDAFVVETEPLRSEGGQLSEYLGASRLEQLQAVFQTEKQIAGEITQGLPVTMSKVINGDQGRPMRHLYYPFTSDGGEMLTLVALLDVGTEASLERFSRLNTVFQLLSLLAAITVAIMLLKITFAPYRRIKNEAIAAHIAQPDQPEAVDFAVEAFQKVIAELKQKEQRLQRLYSDQRDKAANLEQYNDYILANMLSGVVGCDVSGRVTQLNRAAAQILRRSPSSIVGERYAQALADLPVLVHLFDAAVQTGEEHSSREATIMLADGAEVALRMTCQLLHDSRNEVRGAMVLIDDLTTLKHLEAEVTLKEQMAALGEMSAGLAHQLRNSLAAMVGFAQLLQKLASGSVESETIAGNILREARTTEQMLQQFLSYAAPGEIKCQTVGFSQIREVLEEKFAEAAREQGIDLSIEIAESLPQVYCDPLLLTNALVNLVQNALDASEPGDRIQVQAKYLSERESLEITVRDTGSGMDPEQVSKIFNPFYTSGKKQGTGLGLSLARKWIISHRGQITCDSRPGEGSTFTITLPHQTASQVHTPVQPYLHEKAVARN